MENQKPETIKQYKSWLNNEQNVSLDNRAQNYFDSTVKHIRSGIENSLFWKKFTDYLPEYNDEYLIDTGYHLLINDKNPDVLIKSFDSFINKTFRKNILLNSNWPNPPKDGWILPDNWYSRINDVVRTIVVVKYLDGVIYLNKKVDNLCTENKIAFDSQLEAKEEGYYAAHLYTIIPVEVPKINWDTEILNVSFEIQITTQLQEVIKLLLHKYYQDKRSKISKDDVIWQWDYASDEFSTNYLGHILHYVEGMIMDIRERQEKK
jgi:hypothetical protein